LIVSPSSRLAYFGLSATATTSLTLHSALDTPLVVVALALRDEGAFNV